MFQRVLRRLRADIRSGRYVITLHADEELFNDGFMITDVEHAILTGRIEERQRTAIPGQWKYRVRGMSTSGATMEVIVRASSGGTVGVTVYLA
jgi:Domain of unknown function (DUF4258)